jgi:hypothetical protein
MVNLTKLAKQGAVLIPSIILENEVSEHNKSSTIQKRANFITG